MLNTDKAWEKWGKQDPYFGVLAHEKFSGGNIDANRDEFFASGKAFVDETLRRYELHFGGLPRGRALDHGCGVGRVTLPLAQSFSEVLALDVSPSMLAEARANAAESSKANVRFELADDHLTNAPGEFDFVNSLMVLQHIPVQRGLPIFLRLVDKVRPGGGFHLHFSFRTDRGGARLLYWASANVPGVKILQNIHWKRAWNAPAMQMNNYPVNRIFAELTKRGIFEFMTFTQPHSRFVTCSIIGRVPRLG